MWLRPVYSPQPAQTNSDLVLRAHRADLFLVSRSSASFERGINMEAIVEAGCDNCKLTLDQASRDSCA